MEAHEYSNDPDKARWQAEEEARENAYAAQKLKWQKARARSARKAQRKLERLAEQLSESGELSDWEQEFTESVCGRLDQYGSAFQDREKGRPADALSFSQKKVMNAMRKKAAEKAKAKSGFVKKTAALQASESLVPESLVPESLVKGSFVKDRSQRTATSPPPPMVKKPFLRVVSGGAD